MEADSLKLHRLTGYITANGVVMTKTGSGNTVDAAMKRVLRGLANMLRARLEGTECWTYWPDLPQVEQKKWLDYVTERVQWDDSNGGRTE